MQLYCFNLVNQYRAKGLDAETAVIEGGRRRLRPILMTAIATILALLPMALGLSKAGVFIAGPAGYCCDRRADQFDHPDAALSADALCDRRRKSIEGTLRQETRNTTDHLRQKPTGGSRSRMEKYRST